MRKCQIQHLNMGMLLAFQCPKMRIFWVYLDAKGQVKVHEMKKNDPY